MRNQLMTMTKIHKHFILHKPYGYLSQLINNLANSHKLEKCVQRHLSPADTAEWDKYDQLIKDQLTKLRRLHV